MNAASLPPDVEIAAGWDACMASIARPAAQGKIKALFEQGFHKPGDVEDRLGSYVGRLGHARLTASNDASLQSSPISLIRKDTDHGFACLRKEHRRPRRSGSHRAPKYRLPFV